jgi:hypothetical protein
MVHKIENELYNYYTLTLRVITITNSKVAQNQMDLHSNLSL